MTPEKTERLKWLQERGLPLTVPQSRELDALRRELALEVETADDPATLFVDESRRPDVLTGGDYLAEVRARIASENLEKLKKVGLELVHLLEPLALTALHGLLMRGEAQLPAQLQPFADVVRGAAEQAARTGLDDVGRLP